MINIEIDCAWWYDWQTVGPRDLVPEGTKVIQSASGHLIRPVLMPTPTMNATSMRFEGIEEYVAGRAAVGKTKSLAMAVVHHLEETADGRPPTAAWTDMRVTILGQSDLAAKLEGQLKALYDLPKKADAPPPAAAVIVAPLAEEELVKLREELATTKAELARVIADKES